MADFDGLELNGVALTRDVDYKAEQGSIIITLFESYLRTLTVDVEYVFTAIISGNPVILSPIRPTAAPVAQQNTEPVAVPRTGTSSQLFIWLTVFTLSGAVIVVTTVSLKREKSK